ncbi:MAG TPA: hypothetical protein VMU95_15560 [Trebonia sp.]|nr:hypothetical protein [Trebonia sp.]
MSAVSMPYTSRVADRVTADIARWAGARQLAPIAVASFSLGFGIIAAAWFTETSAQAQVIGCAFLVVSASTAQVARAMKGPKVTAATEWGRAACVLLAELAVYAGLAASGGQALDGLTGPFGPMLRSTIVDRAAGHAAAGAWLLAVLAAVILVLLHVADLCRSGPAARLPRLGSARLLLAGLALLLAGPRAALLVAIAFSLLALLYDLLRRERTEDTGAPATPSATVVAGYRGDGPLSAWIGGFVEGRLPPMTPLLVGLLVTCMLAALGLRNLPGILVLTPAEAMLLAALGSSHLHDGRGDWRVPPLLQAGEYVFLAAACYAGHVPAYVTLGLVSAVGLRHLDMAYRARNRVPLSWFMTRRPSRLPRADWRGLGWEGRMILVGFALLLGITPFVCLALAAYLAVLSALDFLAGWSNASLVASRLGGYPSADR